MAILTDISARLEFSRRAAVSQELERRLADVQRKRIEAEDKARKDLREEDDFIQAVQEILATEQQIADFSARLDTYDTATVEALLDNERDLADVRERIDQALGEAIVLPDGRRAFKSEDGNRVFDEHGVELAPEVIQPEAVPDQLPRFEPYWEARTRESELVRERQDLLEYQDSLDQARTQLDDDELTTQDLKDLQADLDKAMPARVREALERNGVQERPAPSVEDAIPSNRQPSDAPRSAPTPQTP